MLLGATLFQQLASGLFLGMFLVTSWAARNGSSHLARKTVRSPLQA